MARRHQNPSQGSATAVDSETRRNTVERLIEKGNVKEAFKQAKFYFHQEATPENRRLVERTYLLRIQALIRGNMLSAGREVALSLLEFGATDPSLTEELVLLLPRVGLADKALSLQGQLQSPEVQARLLTKLADRAVLHPEETPASMPELRVAAEQVRSALAALDSGNDAQALELLQPIPRGSPVADWRFFVRGLAAFRREDLEQATANWERLDPQRAARKIAVALLPVSDQESTGDRLLQLRTLELSAFGEPVLERITALRGALEAADWKRVLQLVGPLRTSLHRIDPRYAQRLTDIMLPPLSAEIMRESFQAAERLIKEFKAALEPLPWDPHWNRFQALLWEGPQGSRDEAITYWKKYLQDLDRGTPVPFGELRQVQALVWRRIGQIAADQASDAEFERFGDTATEPDEATNHFRNQAVEALQQSLRCDPTQRKTYELLIENYTSWDQPQLLISALTRLLEAFPTDIDAIRQLIDQHRRRDEPEPVLKYVDRLRALKPLDTESSEDETWARLALARYLALKKRWEEGRAEFDRVETSLKEHVLPFRLLSRRAAFEFKAGNAPRAEEFIEQARSTLNEPTLLWLSLAIEAARYKLPQPVTKRFNQEFKAALAGKVTSETAGGLAELMLGYLVSQLNYTGRAGHVQEIVRYLRRTTRLKYQEQDLRHVCGLLQIWGKETKLPSTLVRRGLRLFPKSPFFLQLDAEQDLMDRPGFFGAQLARKKLEQALALAEASPDPQDTRLIPIIKQTLARVEDLGDALKSLPFMPDAMPRTFEEFKDMFESMFPNFNREPDVEFNEPNASRPRPSDRRGK